MGIVNSSWGSSVEDLDGEGGLARFPRQHERDLFYSSDEYHWVVQPFRTDDEPFWDTALVQRETRGLHDGDMLESSELQFYAGLTWDLEICFPKEWGRKEWTSGE